MSFAPSILSWPDSTPLNRSAYELMIPDDIVGRLDVWKVPKCKAYPDGYFDAISTTKVVAEPACASWKATRLITISLSPSSDGRPSNHMIIFQHPDLVVDQQKLNPRGV